MIFLLLLLTVFLVLCTLFSACGIFFEDDPLIWTITTIIFAFFTYKSYSKYKSKYLAKREEVQRGQSNSSTTQIDKSVNPYVDVEELEATGQIHPIEYPELILKKEEAVYFATPAKTFTSKEKVVGYEGGSVGGSVRVAKGLTIRTSSSKGSPVRKNVYKFCDGDYVVTNKRVVFLGTEDSFEIPLEKITSIKLIATDAFSIISGTKIKNVLFDESQIKAAYNVTTTLISES